MLAGELPFDGVDTLLFTHDHPDHFSPDRLMQYLRYRTVRQVVLPVMEPQLTGCRQDLDLLTKAKNC